MIKKGMFVRCPIDREYPLNPRVFATGKVVNVNNFNETAHIKFQDPFGLKKYFDFIPDEVEELPIGDLEHCHIYKKSLVKVGEKIATIIEYKGKFGKGFKYYLKDNDTKGYTCLGEDEITASFFSGSAKPHQQLKKYEFQNPCWYLARQIVKETMNILDNSIFGFKELAGCKIYLKAFQLNTIMQCLQGETCRYMLADEVGLGKTIEACSVLKIYLINNNDSNVLITVPKVLVSQWRTELLFKFGIVDGENENSNHITLIAVEDLANMYYEKKWDFIIVDEVHNYLNEYILYEKLHRLSKKSENIILLSATPIQQRKEEYLNLLRLILPEKYDEISIKEFSELLEKQNKISRKAHSILDGIDSFKNELLPEVDKDELYNNEDIQDELEEIQELLDELSIIINDQTLTNMIDNLDTESEDFGMHSIQVIISYICDNYQIERNIIRGRRAVLGVYPKDLYGEFSERRLEELIYTIDEEKMYYENEAYRTLMEWILSIQDDLDNEKITTMIRPLLETFFSSPWAYKAMLDKVNLERKIPSKVIKSAERWGIDEDESIDNIADLLDDINEHPSRLIKLLYFIDTELFGKKVVIFTEYIETFNVYYKLLREMYDDEVTGFSNELEILEAEKNIYRFQSDPKCKILVCDRTGGEGRNLQIADYVVHIDLPWNINSIEQRIGRLDRLGHDVSLPVTSVVIHSNNSYEDQLFKFWNEGLNVFKQSLSGLEIIMNEINQKIIDSIKTDFEFGLYRLIPDLIIEASKMREMVHREQIFDTTALRFRPLYIELEKLLANYQFNENKLFTETMMSWASLAGFGKISHKKDSSLIMFDENSFSIKSAQNSFLIPPDWATYLSKKQNETLIKVQRSIEATNDYNNRTIKGTFDRDTGIKNDYIHFYAPGDEIFDCIVDNALHSYRGMCTAFAAEASVEWKGFIYTYSIEPNERLLLDNGISLYNLGMFRQYLATSIQVIPIPFSSYNNVDEKSVLAEHKRISQMGYFNRSDSIEHLGRRRKEDGFLRISSKFHSSNIEWFKGQYRDETWEKFVDKSYFFSYKKARKKFVRESNLGGAKDMIEQLIATRESRLRYFGEACYESIDEIKRCYEIIYESLTKPIIRIESASFVWLVKNE